MSVKGPFSESELAHCHDPGNRHTVEVGNGCGQLGADLGLQRGDVHPARLVDVGDGDRQVEFAQVIPVIVVGPGSGSPSSPPAPNRTVTL